MPLNLKNQKRGVLPLRLESLVRVMPPVAIRNDSEHARALEMIDRLMQIETLAPAQGQYLETLVQLVENYEARCHAIEVSHLTGLRMLKHVMQQSSMTASGLARLLKVHASMGSKILKGGRQLTWTHAKTLSKHFKVSPLLFLDA